MAIPTSQAQAEFTQDLIAVYKEMPKPTSFLRSFFPTKTSATKYVSIAVQRGSEKIAVDVERGTEGNRNSFGKKSEKIWLPPLFKEYFDMTELDIYDRLYTSTDISVGIYSQLLQETADAMMALESKIERAYELQCSQVFQTGIVTLNEGTNIDFKRKAASMIDLTNINANRYWTVANDATATPMADMEAGALFLRQYGKASGGVFNVKMGTTAFSNFLKLTDVKGNLDNRRIDLGSIRPAQRNATGGVLHGEVSSGAYLFRLWTYPEYYDNASGVQTPYIDPTYMIITPEQTNFQLAFAAVPQLLTRGQAPIQAPFVYSEYIDERNKTHNQVVESAGIAVPVAVDQIYTVKVNA